ncbi:MAG: EAL domain-containing protein [Pseudomonadota bacterium]
MSEKSLPSHESIALGREIVVARQPIMNRAQTVFAYALLYRRVASNCAIEADQAGEENGTAAQFFPQLTESVLQSLTGDAIGFIRIDQSVLFDHCVESLPAAQVIFQISATIDATPALILRLQGLVRAGYTFALADVKAITEQMAALLPCIEIIEVDINAVAGNALSDLIRQIKTVGKKIAANHVQSIEQFQFCAGQGVDYFQGYYFAEPVFLSGKKISPTELAILQLMKLIEVDADHPQLERCIKHDASIGLNLLRMVNTPAAGGHQRISSLTQAILILGRSHLQRWLQILLYAKPDKNQPQPSPLLLLATTRGKLIELMVHKLKPGNRSVADTGFTVGIMSLMDALFGVPMEEILLQIAVTDEVSSALLRRKGLLGDMLSLVEQFEKMDASGSLPLPLLGQLRLSMEDLYMMQMTAFDWVNKMPRTGA